MVVVTSLILFWFVLRDWPKLVNNFIQIRELISNYKYEQYWKKRGL